MYMYMKIAFVCIYTRIHTSRSFASVCIYLRVCDLCIHVCIEKTRTHTKMR